MPIQGVPLVVMVWPAPLFILPVALTLNFVKNSHYFTPVTGFGDLRHRVNALDKSSDARIAAEWVLLLVQAPGSSRYVSRVVVKRFISWISAAVCVI